MAKTLKSALSGICLMQTVKMSIPVPCKIEYTVRHKGDGNNKLRVRCGNYWHLIWAKVHDFDLDPGTSKSRTLEITSDATGTDDAMQDFRWRLSRSILSKAIAWELTYSVTRLHGGIDATNECPATVINDKE